MTVSGSRDVVREFAGLVRNTLRHKTAFVTTWRELAVVCAIVLAVVSLATLTANPHFIGEDEGVYAALGASIATTGEYRLINLPSRPNGTKYPPVYPALLAIAWAAAPEAPGNLTVLKHVNAALLGVITLLYWSLVRRRLGLSPTERVLGVVVVVSGPGLFSFSDMLLSELAFVALLLLSLLLVTTGGVLSPRRAAALGAAAGLSAMTRVVGVAVVAAVIWHAIQEWGIRRAWPVVALSLAIIAPWFFWVMFATDQTIGPLEQFYVAYEPSAWSHLLSDPDPSFALRMMRANAWIYAAALPLVFGLYVVPLAVAAGVVAAAGIVAFPSAEQRRLLIRVSACYLFVIIGHPIPMGRYLVPYIPICGLFLLAGVAWLKQSPAGLQPAARIVGLAGLSCVAIGNGIWLQHFAATGSDRPQWHFGIRPTFSWSGFDQVSDWIRTHTGPDVILASAFAPVYSFQTGRPAVRPWLHRPEEYLPQYGRHVATETSDTTVAHELDRLGVGYLIMDPMGSSGESEHASHTIRRVLERESQSWRLAFISRDHRHFVYKRTFP